MASHNYQTHDWLAERLMDIVEFYYPTCIDEEHGGYIAQLDEETGSVYDAQSKHLVATARYTVNFCVAEQYDDRDWIPAATRGVEFLHNEHYDEETGGYDWLLEGTATVDKSRVCYGHAFVLLAYARAAEIGIDGADELVEEVYEFMMETFWEPEHSLCKSEFDPSFTQPAEYRGQNANMHTCEAMLAAYEAMGEDTYLDRASEIAHALTVDLAEETDGLIWEHYTSDWNHDMDYNRDDPRHQFRPWGYQPGHHIEWAKLLAVLDRYISAAWPLERAKELFDLAIEHGWDDQYGGFYYTFDLDGQPIVEDKYGWPVAEGIGAAAALYERTENERYREWYTRLWEYAESHLTAPGGNWYEKLARNNQSYDTERGPTVEPGYHPIGACFEGLRSFSK